MAKLDNKIAVLQDRLKKLEAQQREIYDKVVFLWHQYERGTAIQNARRQ